VTQVFWYYANKNQSPLVTPEFLERQRRVLMPTQFAREHQNLWVDAADSFVPADQVDEAMGHGWAMQHAGDPRQRYVVAVDLGFVHDPSVIAVGHAEANLVYIDRLDTFQGTREAPVSLDAVEGTLLDLVQRFTVTKIRVESWQGIGTGQRLQQRGLPVEIFAPTAKAHAEEWPQLAQRFAQRTIVLPVHAPLREELLNLTAELGPTGVKVSDRGSVHQDHAVAVRMVAAMLATPAQTCAFAGTPYCTLPGCRGAHFISLNHPMAEPSAMPPQVCAICASREHDAPTCPDASRWFHSQPWWKRLSGGGR